MDVEFITDKPGITRVQRRALGGRFPEWIVLEATKMGGTPADGLWHYKRVQPPAPPGKDVPLPYYIFDHGQEV